VSGALTDTIATLAPGASVTYTITAVISPSATGIVTNTASVTAADDINPTNNSATDVDELVARPDVQVTKTDGLGTMVPGATATYTVVVTNTGPSTATNVQVSDLVPAGVSSFKWSGHGHTNVVGPLADTIASLAPGASVTYTIVAAVNPTATGSLSNTATVTAANDPNPANDSATDTDVLTPVADLKVKKGSNLAVVSPGGMLTYNVRVYNLGPSTVTAFKLTDFMPFLFAPTKFKASTGTYDPATHMWTGLTLAKGQSVLLTITGRVALTARGWMSNQVRADPTPDFVDPVLTNNVARHLVWVAPPSKRWFF
jgi:uncharacterized repeat protein (TIGR01451 family)